MAARKNAKNAASYKEFDLEGKEFNYSGRIYTDSKRKAGKLTIYPMSLTLNDLITIKGCSFYMTKNNMWVGGPQFESGDEYKEYLFIDKELNQDMDALAEAISKVIE